MLGVQVLAINEAHQPKLLTCMVIGEDATRPSRRLVHALISAVVLPSQIIAR